MLMAGYTIDHNSLTLGTLYLPGLCSPVIIAFIKTHLF